MTYSLFRPLLAGPSVVFLKEYHCSYVKIPTENWTPRYKYRFRRLNNGWVPDTNNKSIQENNNSSRQIMWVTPPSYLI